MCQPRLSPKEQRLKLLAREAREEREARELEAQPPEAAARPLTISGDRDPLTLFLEGLALARRAGMPWEQALDPTLTVALSVEADKRERDQWTAALHATLSAWRSAYERRSTGCAL
jgi:hypothetical protein